MGLPRPAWAASARRPRSMPPSSMPAPRSASSGRRASRRSTRSTSPGPKWKELTGIDVKVIEVPTAEMFTKILQEHRAGAGAYDALNVIPSWMPDLVRAGALEDLDPYVDKYGYPRGAAGDRARLPRQPDDGRRQDLRLPGRRRRLRHVLPHGRAGRSQDPGGVQGQVRRRSAGAADDLEGVRSGRLDRSPKSPAASPTAPASSATRPMASSCSRSASATMAAGSSTRPR